MRLRGHLEQRIADRQLRPGRQVVDSDVEVNVELITGWGPVLRLSLPEMSLAARADITVT